MQKLQLAHVKFILFNLCTGLDDNILLYCSAIISVGLTIPLQRDLSADSLESQKQEAGTSPNTLPAVQPLTEPFGRETATLNSQAY